MNFSGQEYVDFLLIWQYFFAQIFVDFLTNLAVVGLLVDGFSSNPAHLMRNHVPHNYFFGWKNNNQPFLSYEFFKMENVGIFENFCRNFFTMTQVFVGKIRDIPHVDRWTLPHIMKRIFNESYQVTFEFYDILFLNSHFFEYSTLSILLEFVQKRCQWTPMSKILWYNVVFTDILCVFHSCCTHSH